MARRIVIDRNTEEISIRIWNFDSVSEAVFYAKTQWAHLTDREQKESSIKVVEEDENGDQWQTFWASPEWVPHLLRPIEGDEEEHK